MRGQIRHLNRVLYPNRVVRSVRAVLAATFRLGGGLLQTAFKALNTLLAAMTGTQGIHRNAWNRPAANRSLINPVRQQAMHNGMDSRQQPNPTLARPQQQPQPVKQNGRSRPRVVQMDTQGQGQHV